MPWLERHAIWVAAALALLHFGLALAYAAVTPYRSPGVSNGQFLLDIGNPDEIAHSEYIAFIVDGNGLPVLQPLEARALRTFEFHQPPVYYVLSAGWCRLIGADPRNRDAGLGVRSLNALIGAGTVLGVYFVGLWATGRPRTALLAGGMAALLPMLAALNGAVSNDPLTICLCTWALALLARWRESWTPVRALAIGSLIGLTFLVKSTGLLLIPAFVVLVWQTGPDRRGRNLTLGLVASLVIMAPWMARNQGLYGDLLGMNAFNQAFPADLNAGDVFSGLRPLARWLYVLAAGTGLSFVGVFGYMDIHLSYSLYIPILTLAVVGILMAIRVQESGPIRVPLFLFVGLLVLSYLAFNSRYVQPQSRYLFPAIAPLCIWIVMGLERLGRSRPFLIPAALLSLLALANISALSKLPAEFRLRMERASEGFWSK